MKKNDRENGAALQNIFPLTATQNGFFFLQQKNVASPLLNMLRLDEIKGVLNETQLIDAIKKVVKRHSIFRMRFFQKEEEVVQEVLAEDQIEIQVGMTDLSSVSKGEQQQLILIKKANALGSQAFDLMSPPLIRTHLFRLGMTEYVLLRVVHHLVGDFKSNRLFLDEVAMVYEGLSPPKPTGFGDYALWEKENLNDKTLSAHLEYWKAKLADPPECLHLPLDYPRPAVSGSKFKLCSRALPRELWERYKALAYKEKNSIFQMAMAAFMLFLHHYSGDEDITIGSNIDFRKARSLPRLIGPGINHFILRSQYSPETPFLKFASQVSKAAKEAYAHSDFSIDRIIKLLKIPRSLSHSPLFQAIFDIWQPEEEIEQKFKLKFSRFDYAWLHGNVDLYGRIVQNKNSVTLWFRYNAELFENSTVERMAESFETLLESILENPEQKVKCLRLVSKKEEKRCLETISGIEVEYEKCQGIQQYFETQVDKTPDFPALDFESHFLTYKELDQKANQLAQYLRANGITRDVFVGLLLDRSHELFIGILAVLKAGGAYVPLDPAYPLERLQFLVEDIEAPILLTQKHLFQDLGNKKIKILKVDEDWASQVASYPTTRLDVINEPQDAAYMIYTSGSTGKPKGCPNTHQNIANYLQWVKAKHPMSAEDSLLFRTPYTFDVSVPEILYPLLCGAKVVICTPNKHGDTPYIVELIQSKNITEVGFVPSTLQVLLEEEGIRNCKSLKIVTAIGEALSVEVVKRFYECLPNANLINSYGPTEAAVAVTYWDCSRDDSATVPIGFPIPNTKIYILNEVLKMVPQGVLGEIFIGGVQVARGYWKRPDITDERFVKDPFSSLNGARMYKTGDRGRFNAKGVLEYQGRMDFQVKVRGYRIELGEIEAALVEHPSLQQAAVVVKKLHGDQGAASMVAFYITKPSATVTSTVLREFLKAKLPEYMIPSGFVRLESLPVITSGKVNRKALMERHDDLGLTSEDQPSFAPAVSVSEKKLVEIWEDILLVKPISRDANYFSLGGDSLGLIRILHRLKDHHFAVKLEDLYNYQTIEELGRFIDRQSPEGSPLASELPPIESISRKSKEKKFGLSFQQAGFWSGVVESGGTSFITMVNSLEGPLDVELLKSCVEVIMKRHWVLNTKFVVEDKKVFQVISSPETEYFTEKDLRSLPDDKVEEALLEEIRKAAGSEINVQVSPLFRCHLIRVYEEQFFILVKGHHIIWDGQSLDIFRKELKELYSAKIEKRASSLPELALQYVDFVHWEKEIWKNDNLMKSHLDYWKEYLHGVPALVFEPQKKSKDGGEGYIFRVLSKEKVKALSEFSKKQNVSLYVTILAAFSSFLGQLCSQKEIVFRTVFSQRPPEIENIMGYFMAIMPFRINLNAFSNTAALLREVRDRSVLAQAHLIPTHKVFDALNSEKDREALGRMNVMFNYTTGFRDPLMLPGIRSENIEFEGNGGAMDGMFVQFSVSANEVNFSISCDKSVVSDDELTRMADLFETAMHTIQK